jgi:hypothetical protein
MTILSVFPRRYSWSGFGAAIGLAPVSLGGRKLLSCGKEIADCRALKSVGSALPPILDEKKLASYVFRPRS